MLRTKKEGRKRERERERGRANSSALDQIERVNNSFTVKRRKKEGKIEEKFPFDDSSKNSNIEEWQTSRIIVFEFGWNVGKGL